ncbi:MAG TPA: hypothetical protein VN456_14065 [Desulfosporosinus sp.]|nr:hypothetical protein [Desulfosporosinus sp.]
MHPSDITLQIYHQHFKIPLEAYLNTVADFLDPWDEQAYQFVVNQYLAERKDSGIVGMVRQEKDENYIYLDAAVCYPLTMDGRVSPVSHDSNKDVRG